MHTLTSIPLGKDPQLWFVVAVKKGEKNIAALRLIRQALEGVEKERIQEWEADISDDKPKTPPQFKLTTLVLRNCIQS